MRDILLGHYPLTWVQHPKYIVIVAIAAIVTTWVASFMKHLRPVFLVLDAFGLIVFSIISAQIALNMQQSAIIAAISAVIKGVFGGVLRDMFCNCIPLVFQKEIYAGISFAAAWIYIALQQTPLSYNWVVIITLLVGLSARLLALRFRLGLPVFKYEQ